MIGVGEEGLVAKVLAEEAEFPEVVGDIFADVGDGAVGADDNFGVFVQLTSGDVGAGAGHDPAALVLAFGLGVEDSGLLELLEGGIPEFEVEDFAFAGQEIVFDVEAEHGFKMAAEDCGGDELGYLGSLVVALLNLVQGGIAELFAGCVFFFASLLVPLRGFGVEVPAVVVNALDTCGVAARAFCAKFKFGQKCADLLQRHRLQVLKTDDDIGDLNAGVVNVVLDVDFLAGGSQEADERIAEDGVAQVADVGGFVGIDAGVLDHCMERTFEWGWDRGDGGGSGGAIEAGVDVAGAGDFEAGEAIDRAEGGYDLLGDDFWGFAELAGEFKGDGRGEFAEFQVGGNLDGDGLDIEVVLCLQNRAKGCAKPLLQFEIHVESGLKNV